MSYNDLLKQAFIDTIKEDYIKFITSLKDKYPNEIPLSIEELIKKYEIKKFISIEPKESRARKTYHVADSAIRCRARVWGGKESVYYDREKNKWNYDDYTSKERTYELDDILINYLISIL